MRATVTTFLLICLSACQTQTGLGVDFGGQPLPPSPPVQTHNFDGEWRFEGNSEVFCIDIRQSAVVFFYTGCAVPTGQPLTLTLTKSSTHLTLEFIVTAVGGDAANYRIDGIERFSADAWRVRYTITTAHSDGRSPFVNGPFEGNIFRVSS